MPSNIKITKDIAARLYYKLYLFRRLEEIVAQLYRQGKVAGFCHLYIGQEAVATGIDYHMSSKDSIITSYRDHVHALLHGGTIKSVLAELIGSEEGMVGGKGGSMHFFNKEHNFYGGQAIVGTTVPLGAGAAFAHKYRKDGGVSVAYIGDGAILQGQVAEALNMAALWQLPLIVAIENNQYAMGTSVKRSHANNDISVLGVPYNIKTIKVNGMDIVDVVNKSQEAFEYTRGDKGPIILDIDTYRYRGHSMSDPGKYRTREEIDHFRIKDDPIINFTKYVKDNNLLNDKAIKDIESGIEKEFSEAEKYLDTIKEPNESELYTHVYK